MKNSDLTGLQEIPITPEAMQLLLANIPKDMILVGGQALAFWLEHFGIDPMLGRHDSAFISMDADLLGKREHVRALADAVSGVANYPPRQAMTILSGQIFLVNRNDGTYMNIDVIHRIGNMSSNDVRRRSVEASVQGVPFRVMHPLDVLVSRLENFRGIRDKQNELGLRQVRLAIAVAGEFVAEAAGRDEGIATRAVEVIASAARSAAGIYARKHGAEVYDAIRPVRLAKLISDPNFRAVRLPRLSEESRAARQRATKVR